MESQPAKLCLSCQRLFSRRIELTYGTFHHLPHWALLDASCHLCHIVVTAWERLSRDAHPSRQRHKRAPGRFRHSGGVGEEDEAQLWSTLKKHPTPVQYALKVFNDDWARYGHGPMWPVLDFNGNYEDHVEVAHATRKAHIDPTDYGLAKLLSTDADELTDGSIEFWLSLVFADYVRNSIVLPLEIDTYNEAEVIAQTNLGRQSSTGTPENMRLAKHWLQSCLKNHPRCRSSARAQTGGWLPARLLDIGSDHSPRVRLVSTARRDLGDVSYAALSYRWGDQSQFCLKSANIEQYHESILFSDLSKTLQEAIQTCRSIGLGYLWVDALCIIQGDIHDWSRESAAMSKVYGFATCTIAAANSGDGEGRCFTTRNQYQVRPCSVPNPLNPYSSKHRFYIRPQFLKDIFKQEVRRSEWYTRGWVFQERILSSRLLIFGKTQMLWACQELQAAESWPTGKTSENFIDQFESFEVEKARFEKLLDPSRHVTAINDLWAVLIRDYAASDNNFTKMPDRFMALQGLASQIQESTDRRYCAGLWLDDSLPASLLWTARGPRLERSADSRVPSWSWASLNCGIDFNSGRFKGIAVIRGIEVPDAGKDSNENEEAGIPLRLWASGRVLRVSITTKVVKVSDGSAAGRGLAVYTGRVPRPQQRTIEMKDTSTPFRRACTQIARKIQSTGKEIMRNTQLEANKISRKCRSLLNDSGIPSALHWGYERILEPLFYGSLLLLLLLCGLLLIGILLALLPLMPIVGGILLAHEALGSPLKLPDIETGKMVPSADDSKDPDLRASCYFDCPASSSETEDEQPTFIVPILDGHRTSGLIVQLVEVPGTPKGETVGGRYYKRLGVFEMNSFELRKFRTDASASPGSTFVEQNFYLI